MPQMEGKSLLLKRILTCTEEPASTLDVSHPNHLLRVQLFLQSLILLLKKRQGCTGKPLKKKTKLTDTLRDKNYHKVADLENADVYNGTASFIDSRHVAVALQAETLELEADQIFINTGARPFIPPIEGLSDSRRAYISETMLSLEELPKHLVIIGGGYIGMEFASIYTNFGSRVTVIQDGEVFLPREDRDIADAVAESLKERGVKLLLSTKINSVRDEEAKTIVSVKTPEGDEKISADAVLVATGRRPNVNDLNLEAAGVELTPSGAVRTDEFLQTNVPGIYAMGDVVGGLQFTYISLDDFRIVKSQILGDKKRNVNNRAFKSRNRYEDKRDFRCSSVLRRIPRNDQPDQTRYGCTSSIYRAERYNLHPSDHERGTQRLI